MVHKEFVQCGDKSDGSHYHDDAAHNAVEQPQRPEIEMGSYLVDKPCDAKPPQDCPGKDGGVAGNVVIGLKFRREEAAPGKEGWRM